MKKSKTNKSEPPKHLYKYATIDSVPHILNNSSIKITNPTEFNDPFDCNFPSFNLEKVDMIKIAKSAFLSSSKSKKIDPKIEFILRQQTGKANELKASIQKDFDKLTDQWSVLLNQLRVLSLTTKPDNILMWSHYADFHKGATLKFRYDPTSTFGSAKKVKYDDGETLLPNFMEEMIKKLANSVFSDDEGTQQKTADTSSTEALYILLNYLFLKKKEWAYEGEYRIILEKTNAKIITNPSQNIDTIKFNPDELEEIIFGVSIDPDKTKIIEKIVESKFSNTKLVFAKKNGWNLLI
jgi:hypothetical protein